MAEKWFVDTAVIFGRRESIPPKWETSFTIYCSARVTGRKPHASSRHAIYSGGAWRKRIIATVAALGRNNCPPWPRVVGGAFMISARAPSGNVRSQISGFLPVHKVSKLPTAIYPPDAGPVTIVV